MLWKNIVCAKHVLREKKKSLTSPQHLSSSIPSWDNSVDKVCKLFIFRSVETEVDMLPEICDICDINKAIPLLFSKGQMQRFLRC